MPNIYLRLISGIIIVTSFTVVILYRPIWLDTLMCFIGIGMIVEWCSMTRSSMLYTFLGFIIVPIPIVSVILINTSYDHRLLLMLYFVIVWSTDTFAMIGGKTLGGAKLAPILSPKKTWSGLIVGCFSAATFGLVLLRFLQVNNDFIATVWFCSNLFRSLIFILAIAVLAQISDLFISFFKRKFSVKDTGNIIPGHGGVLDRFDSMVLTAPALLFCILLNHSSKMIM